LIKYQDPLPLSHQAEPGSDTTVGESGEARRNHGSMLPNLKALGLWVTSLINPTFFPYIVDVRLNNSTLNFLVLLLQCSETFEILIWKIQEDRGEN
jgi:hypothetical protein